MTLSQALLTYPTSLCVSVDCHKLALTVRSILVSAVLSGNSLAIRHPCIPDNCSCHSARTALHSCTPCVLEAASRPGLSAREREGGRGAEGAAPNPSPRARRTSRRNDEAATSRASCQGLCCRGVTSDLAANFGSTCFGFAKF